MYSNSDDWKILASITNAILNIDQEIEDKNKSKSKKHRQIETESHNLDHSHKNKIEKREQAFNQNFSFLVNTISSGLVSYSVVSLLNHIKETVISLYPFSFPFKIYNASMEHLIKPTFNSALNSTVKLGKIITKTLDDPGVQTTLSNIMEYAIKPHFYMLLNSTRKLTKVITKTLDDPGVQTTLFNTHEGKPFNPTISNHLQHSYISSKNPILQSKKDHLNSTSHERNITTQSTTPPSPINSDNPSSLFNWINDNLNIQPFDYVAFIISFLLIYHKLNPVIQTFFSNKFFSNQNDSKVLEKSLTLLDDEINSDTALTLAIYFLIFNEYNFSILKEINSDCKDKDNYENDRKKYKNAKEEIEDSFEKKIKQQRKSELNDSLAAPIKEHIQKAAHLAATLLAKMPIDQINILLPNFKQRLAQLKIDTPTKLSEKSTLNQESFFSESKVAQKEKNKECVIDMPSFSP